MIFVVSIRGDKSTLLPPGGFRNLLQAPSGADKREASASSWYKRAGLFIWPNSARLNKWEEIHDAKMCRPYILYQSLADPGFEVKGGVWSGSHKSQRAQATASDKQKKGRLSSSLAEGGGGILGGRAYAPYAPRIRHCQYLVLDDEWSTPRTIFWRVYIGQLII